MEKIEEVTFYGLFIIISSGGIPLAYSFRNSDLRVGQLVCVPLKSGKLEKTVVAVFLNFCEKPKFDCRPIHNIFPYSIILKKAQLDLIHRVSEYYLSPLETCIRLLAPGFLWKTDKIPTFCKYFEKALSQHGSEISSCGSAASPRGLTAGPSHLNVGAADPPGDSNEITLSPTQQIVFDNILNNLTHTILLHGVTGSGKTEVYLSVAKHIIGLKKNCLILVPEISLTPQMTARFKKIFGDQLSILHSGLSQTVLIKEWSNIYLGKARVVLGVRTAIFCPLENIGLIIIDEEHDQSYKSSEKPCYNARDVAVMRAKLEGACCILGSATPSLESYWNTKVQKYKYIELADKYAVSTKVKSLIFETSKSPHFKSSRVESKNYEILPAILELIRENLSNKFQTIVILNRRGFVNYALCEGCHTPLSCPRCSVATTLHNFGRREICHYCDFNRETRKICPECHGEKFLHKGIGTQNIESFLQSQIPNLQIERLDRDTITSHSKLSKILERFGQQQTDCLVGTQILAKGHDFSKATLIVILNLEDGLFLPDFRATEKTFHLLTQAMGRVGRGKYPGIVAIQSCVKSHYVIDLALQNNVKEFLESELKNRMRAGLPPYSRLILLEIRHTNKILAEKYAQSIKNVCLEHWKKQEFNPSEIFLSGPYDAPIEKINKIYRLHMCIHMSKHIHPKNGVLTSLAFSPHLRNILKIDVDPQSFM